MTQVTKYYEVSYLVGPSVNDVEVTAIDENLRTLLGSFDAVIDSWDSPKRRRLAYPIDKVTEAFFGALRFTAPREHAGKINETLKKTKNILRFMLLKWHKTPPRRMPRIMTTPAKEEQVPTDEKALDEKLEEIFGVAI